MKGKLIVFEGSDGSGKTTQLNLFKKYLKSKGTQVEVVDFPQYDSSFYGRLLRRFHDGELGSLKDSNPYLMSVIFALDRAGIAKQMTEWLNEGKTVLANRYLASNMAHQAGRLPRDKIEEFIRWDEELEYEVNKIPKEDLVIFLHVPYRISETLIEEKDISEKDSEYLRNAEKNYIYLSKFFKNWVTVECAPSGKLRSVDDIQKEVVKIIEEKL